MSGQNWHLWDSPIVWSLLLKMFISSRQLLFLKCLRVLRFHHCARTITCSSQNPEFRFAQRLFLWGLLVCLFVLRRWRKWVQGEQRAMKHGAMHLSRALGKFSYLQGQGGFFLISSSLLSPWLSCSPKIFILVFSLERIIMIKLFNNVALSFIWSLTQESLDALQRLITIHKAQKMDLNLSILQIVRPW